MLSLDPLDDAKVWTAFNAAISAARAVNQDGDERSWDQLQADAVVDHITRPAGAGEHAAPGAEVSVLIDYQALVHGGKGRVAETADGQPLPVEVIRRFGCDGNLVPVWLSADLEVLAVGRQRRLATRAQRRALRAMHRSCCLPGCAVGFERCRIHHVAFWEHHGAPPISTTWCRSARSTITSSTKAAGPCSCTPGGGSPCAAPTAPSPSTASPPTASHRPRSTSTLARKAHRRHTHRRRRHAGGSDHHQRPPPKSPKSSNSPSTRSTPTHHERASSAHRRCHLEARNGRQSAISRIKAVWMRGRATARTGRGASRRRSRTSATERRSGRQAGAAGRPRRRGRRQPRASVGCRR
jgi:hypothetical protein